MTAKRRRKTTRHDPPLPPKPRLKPTDAGLTSALGDSCYETAKVILPGLLAVLGILAAALGMLWVSD